MAVAIEKALGVKAELICGGGGVFDVVADGKKIFSKHEVSRFPEYDEIIAKLK